MRGAANSGSGMRSDTTFALRGQPVAGASACPIERVERRGTLTLLWPSIGVMRPLAESMRATRCAKCSSCALLPPGPG